MREAMCREILEAWGDAQLGEWSEDRSPFFHLRRRLSAEEGLRVGPALDCRTGEEGMRRLREIAAFLPLPAIEMAREELNL